MPVFLTEFKVARCARSKLRSSRLFSCIAREARRPRPTLKFSPPLGIINRVIDRKNEADFEENDTDRVPAISRSPDPWIAAGLGLVSLIVYIRTLCPTIYTDDCGEITTAVTTGGVVHPPGYPLYCLIGLLFTKLIETGEPAWRLGLFSSVCAAGAVAAVFLLCRRLGAGGVWAAIGALAFAFSYTLWQQATKVETYALNALFVALLLNLAVAYAQTGRRALFLSLAAAGGLALTNHLTIIWLVPALLWIVLPTLFVVEAAPWRVFGTAAGLSASMLLLYAYEVIAAITHPGGQVWGDPSTAQRFYLQITGARYHDYFSKLGVSGMVHRDIVFAPSWIAMNVGFLLPFSLVGLVVLWRGAGRRFAQGLLLAILGYLACNTLYGIDNIFEYYTPVVLGLSALGAGGLQVTVDWFLRKSADGGRRPGAAHDDEPASRLRALAAACAFLTLALAPAAKNWRLCDRSHALFVRTLAYDTLAPLPPNAVLVVSGDNRIFPLWYAQDVLGLRRDILILPRDFLWNLDTPVGRETGEWYLKKLGARDTAIHPAALLAECAANPDYARCDGPIWEIARDKYLQNFPVYLSEVVPGDLRPWSGKGQVFEWIHLPVAPTPEGISYRLASATNMPSLDQSLTLNLLLETRLHITSQPPAIFVGEPDGAFSNIVYARCLTQVGNMLIDRKRFVDAYAQLAAATSLDPSSADAAGGFAVACMETGRTAQALSSWQRAAALDPGNPIYHAQLSDTISQMAGASQRRASERRGLAHGPEN